jgi:cell division protease FtsH
MLLRDTVVHKLSVVPRGRRMGVAWLPEATDRLLYPRSVLIERMAMLLAGRTAEEMVFGESSGGASDDLARVGETAHRMVVDFGMSERVRALPPGGNGRSRWSEETARLIDAEASRLVEEAEELAQSALASSRDALDRVAVALIERETLTRDEIDTLAGPPATLPGRNGSGTRSRLSAPAG